MGNLFNTDCQRLRKRLLKAYDESKHPRDERGRWTAGGVTAATAALALAPGLSNLARVSRAMNAGTIKPMGYVTRRWARNPSRSFFPPVNTPGSAREVWHRHAQRAAFTSPYEEMMRAAHRRLAPKSFATRAVQEMGRDTIARRVMHANHWINRWAMGTRPLDRGRRLFT